MFDITILAEGQAIPQSDFALFLTKKGVYKRQKNLLGHGIAPIGKDFLAQLDLSSVAKALLEVTTPEQLIQLMLAGVGLGKAPEGLMDGLKLQEVETSFWMNFPKIPEALWMKVVHFYTLVYDKFQSEAAVLLLYKPETQEWDILVPKQVVTGAHAKYDLNEIITSDERLTKGGFNIVGTSHSHGSMKAFWSGTDDADELNFDGIHVTVGKVNSKVEYAASIVFGGTRFEVKISDLVAMTEPAVSPELETWMGRVGKPEPPKPTVTAVKGDLPPVTDTMWFEGTKIFFPQSMQNTIPDFHKHYTWSLQHKGFVLDAWRKHVEKLNQAPVEMATVADLFNEDDLVEYYEAMANQGPVASIIAAGLA